MGIKSKRRKRITQEAAELNITAFMNLMVILVPFLLITAVFTRMTVLELHLPALGGQDKSQPEDTVSLNLELVLRSEVITLQDARLGVIKQFNLTNITKGNEERKLWRPLTETLTEIKRRFPEEKKIILLIEKDIEYAMMIAVMDRVQIARIVVGTSLETFELFPDVSIGNAYQEGEG